MPKEVFIHHAAGVGGFGGSSYVDSLVCRERDASTAWTAAADALDERRYIGQNWRADVSVVWNTLGSVIEWMRYTPYGEAVTYPWINADFDRSGGTPDSADEDAFYAAWNLGDPSADVNRSGGTPDNADVVAFFEAWNNADAPIDGVGGYSALRIGYAGYQWDPSGTIYHVRHRVYRPDLGRWTRRDPLGYVDGMGLFGYGSNRPIIAIDDSGLLSRVCGQSNNCGSIGVVAPSRSGVSWTNCLGSTDLSGCLLCCAGYEGPGGWMSPCDTACRQRFSDKPLPPLPSPSPSPIAPIPVDQSCNGKLSNDDLANPSVRAAWDRIRAACNGCTPRIICNSNCEGNNYGTTKCVNGQCPSITICTNPRGDVLSPDVRGTLVHELTHALQCCTGLYKKGCMAAICREKAAYEGDPFITGGCRGDLKDCCRDVCGSAVAHCGTMQKCLDQCNGYANIQCLPDGSCPTCN